MTEPGTPIPAPAPEREPEIIYKPYGENLLAPDGQVVRPRRGSLEARIALLELISGRMADDILIDPANSALVRACNRAYENFRDKTTGNKAFENVLRLMHEIAM